MRYFFKNTKKIPQAELPSAIWMNYIPFISNCAGLGAHLDLELMMNLDMPDFTKEKCNIPAANKPINFWTPYIK